MKVIVNCLIIIPYSRKHWRELNLVVGSQIAISTYNLAVQYRIAIYIYAREILADFNLAVAQAICQTAKFNSLPNFPAIRYTIKDHPTISSIWIVHVS